MIRTSDLMFKNDIIRETKMLHKYSANVGILKTDKQTIKYYIKIT